MNNLHTVLSIVLSKIPPKEILNNEIQYDKITMEKFVRLAGYYVKNYSNDELESLFYYIRNEYVERADHFKGFQRNRKPYREEPESFNIFDAILIFAVRTLKEIDGEPVCQYENMMRWRMASHELDEDVFTTAFLAYKDIEQVNNKRMFSWRPVIKHDNIYLRRILSQGMADNHFHLKGSAPQFPLSWISMMNNVLSAKFRTLIDGYSKKRLQVHYSTEMEEEHIYVSYLKAALIRCFLFAKLIGQPFVIEELLEDRESNMNEKNKEGGEKEGEKNKEKDKEEEKKKELEKKKALEKKRELKTEILVEKLLSSNDEILFYRHMIQNNIKEIRLHMKSSIYDYIICNQYNQEGDEENVNAILSGERWFMYRMFQLIFSKDASFKKYYNMFYAYLVIKETMRSELVQTNKNIGFDNFVKYQDRKEDFIENTIYEKPYIQMAVIGTITNQNLMHLEARITPRKTAVDNRNYIKKFDKMLGNDNVLQEKYFYVFHFVKEKDEKENIASDIFCRHYEKRNKLKKQAVAISEFREKYHMEAKRVRGIDACAKEIGCRPEVFAQTFRYLSNHIVYDRHSEYDEPPQQLLMTYHVGEDYMDVLDGLRAIDEAIHYLRLGNGSRLGHALALGEDIEEYYKIKKKKILISQQDYLDNLVWLYYRIKKFELSGYDDLMLFIEQEYNKYFKQIYGNNICDDFFYGTINDARTYFRMKNGNNSRIVEGYCNSNFYFRMSEYYAAWKLRGDNPECYKKGYYEEPDDFSEWNRHAVNKAYPEDYKIRYNPECAYLYFLYHYNSSAKKEGKKVIEITMKHRMIMCIKEVQERMQFWVSNQGIGIEANPSSNYLIGIFKKYEKHPIFKFYNLGLTISQEEIEKCPQIPVCVNTDDQGIFSTYLDNEFALLALALEKVRDENGKNKYNRTMIYEWIDNVRKMGLKLSFVDNNKQYYKQKDLGLEESREIFYSYLDRFGPKEVSLAIRDYFKNYEKY